MQEKIQIEAFDTRWTAHVEAGSTLMPGADFEAASREELWDKIVAFLDASQAVKPVPAQPPVVQPPPRPIPPPIPRPEAMPAPPAAPTPSDLPQVERTIPAEPAAAAADAPVLRMVPRVDADESK
jgi:hypothetical protein